MDRNSLEVTLLQISLPHAFHSVIFFSQLLYLSCKDVRRVKKEKQETEYSFSRAEVDKLHSESPVCSIVSFVKKFLLGTAMPIHLLLWYKV